MRYDEKKAMRKLNYVFLLSFMLLLITGCSKTVTSPFKADFIGTYTNVISGEKANCGGTSYSRAFLDFQGTCTPLGNFSAKIDFCFSLEGKYGPVVFSMVAANGDILFVSQEGKVIKGRLDDHPEYVTEYWRDPFVIIGGTGRFKGATGGGMSDDYNSSKDPNSHHHWVGTITMVKGKR